jgi:hypothetical protein
MNTNIAIAAYWATENAGIFHSFTNEIRLSKKAKTRYLTN